MGGTTAKSSSPGDSAERGFLVLLDVVGSTKTTYEQTPRQNHQFNEHRRHHINLRATRHGLTRLADEGDADLLWLPGEDSQPLTKLFLDLNRLDPVPALQGRTLAFRMVVHHDKFFFTTDATGLRPRQKSDQNVTVLYRLEKLCGAQQLLVTTPVFNDLGDHLPDGWLHESRPLPEPLYELRKVIAEIIHFIRLGEPPPSVPWHPPPSPNHYFGRQDQITRVADLVTCHRHTALVGPGGIGKTALAAEVIKHLEPDPAHPRRFSGGLYNHDYYRSPAHVSALDSILAQARLGNVPDQQKAAEVQRLFQQPGVLLFLEGCEEAKELPRLLELTGHTTVLLSSRDPLQIGDAHQENVRPLDAVAASELLHAAAQSAENLADPARQQAWAELARRLGRHPLALRLAGAWLRRQHAKPEELQLRLTRDGFQAWDTSRNQKEKLRVHLHHCAEAVAPRHPLALGMWFALSLHAHAPVPLPALCGALACKPDAATDALEALAEYSLAEPTEIPGTTIGQFERAWQLTHALLGEWGRGDLRRRRREESLISPPKAAEPQKDLDGASSRRLLPERGDAIFSAWLGWWQADLDNCFDQKSVPGGPARYLALQPHWDALLLNLEAAEGSDSTRLPILLNLTASVHDDMGNYSAAEPLYRRALSVRERVLGPEHPATLTSINNLAGLLESKGDLAATEPLYRRALTVREHVLGPEHPDTLGSVNNLAYLLESKGDLAAAEPLYRRALTVRERVLGPEHPNTLISVNNLASLLAAKGDLAAAEPLLRRALTGSELALGLEHPDVLTSVNNLAGLLYAKGDLAAAEPLLRRALTVRERMLGLEHPDTLTSFNNLASLLQKKGDLAGALPLYERAVQGALLTLGPDHPNTKLFQENLAHVRAQLAKKGKS